MAVFVILYHFLNSQPTGSCSIYYTLFHCQQHFILFLCSPGLLCWTFIEMLGAPRRFHDEPRLPRKRRTPKKLPYRPPAFDRNGKLASLPAHFNHEAAKQRIEQCIMSANERAEPCNLPTKQTIEPCRDPVKIRKIPPRYSEKYAPSGIIF